MLRKILNNDIKNNNENFEVGLLKKKIYDIICDIQ